MTLRGTLHPYGAFFATILTSDATDGCSVSDLKNDSELTAFVKELDREIKTMLFLGWWRKVKMETEVEQTLFDTCFQKFAGDLDTKQLTSLSEELMNFIVRYNP
jgi:hypothetical protein